MKPRYDKAAMRAWIEAQPKRPSGGDVARRFGCCSVTGWVAVRKSKWESGVLAAPAAAQLADRDVPGFPMPRWCQPRKPRPRYRIDDAFPRDIEDSL